MQPQTDSPAARPTRVAIVSFLFNWPSTGGGIVHTAELARFLTRAGYQVRHFYAHYSPWAIGQVRCAPIASVALEFTERDWNLPTIQDRFRKAVDAFAPDFVLITDSWNIKPHLAAAMRGYRTLLRFAALECLCPLNNVRLLCDDGGFFQCVGSQLSDPQACAECLQRRAGQSGGLHRAERDLSGVGTREYDEVLRRALDEAEAVLVLNPEVQALLKPFAPRVHVVPWGMDEARFPWPPRDEPHDVGPRPKVIFQAGLVDEAMKGFPVLHAAAERLWHTRHDFEVVATADPPRRIDPWTRFVGWQSQADLPRLYRAADVVVVPTIAQEGLSRTSVEAMASGKPVVASNIGGLPSTVIDGVTGLLYEPGNADDLAAKLRTLLDAAQLRERMGRAGRRHFEEHFTWDVVIDRYYRPLLGGRLPQAAGPLIDVDHLDRSA